MVWVVKEGVGYYKVHRLNGQLEEEFGPYWLAQKASAAIRPTAHGFYFFTAERKVVKFDADVVDPEEHGPFEAIRHIEPVSGKEHQYYVVSKDDTANVLSFDD